AILTSAISGILFNLQRHLLHRLGSSFILLAASTALILFKVGGVSGCKIAL
ncbi:MAG: hypothetical protein ACI9RV_001853, partial [Glaciecola sp.]